MLRFYEGWFLVALMLDVYCVIDIITSRDDEVRNLPKIAWLLLTLIFTPIGAIAWLVAGRPQRATGTRSPYERSATAYPEYDRPGRAAGLSPESDEEFLRKVRERAEEQRRRHAEQKRADQKGEQEPDA
ncbi:MAG: PLD nuclease N-terminal domain-containing protein [Marmoricola sp.]